MMLNDIFKIGELLSVHTQKSELERKEAELTIPVLTNKEYISLIFEWYCELSGHSGCACDLDTDDKMEFLIIILLLYSPDFFIGHRLRDGIRDILTELFGYKSGSGVSNHLKDIVHTYNNYRTFREKVIVLYLEIENRLKAEGILP